jgi:hypothetical protein
VPCEMELLFDPALAEHPDRPAEKRVAPLEHALPFPAERRPKHPRLRGAERSALRGRLLRTPTNHSTTRSSESCCRRTSRDGRRHDPPAHAGRKVERARSRSAVERQLLPKTWFSRLSGLCSRVDVRVALGRGNIAHATRRCVRPGAIGGQVDELRRGRRQAPGDAHPLTQVAALEPRDSRAHSSQTRLEGVDEGGQPIDPFGRTRHGREDDSAGGWNDRPPAAARTERAVRWRSG